VTCGAEPVDSGLGHRRGRAGGRYDVYSTGTLIDVSTSTDGVSFSNAGSALPAPLTWSADFGTTTDRYALGYDADGWAGRPLSHR
jgi:hypothetical protein